uniref:Uncharacterized protein n=1 Tax=Meloidogyne floridensis TaxID=298350 RepID=A0A915PFR6_9BILA
MILIINAIRDSPYDLTIIYLIVFAFNNSNYLLLECFEEMCLCIMSKDFRKLVKNQFVKNTQTNVVVETVNVAPGIQQGKRKVNIQRNNLINNN